MTNRSWHWLQCRILGLFTRPAGHDANDNPIPANRMQARLRARATDPQQAHGQTGG